LVVGRGFDIAVGQSIEEEVSCEFFVFIAGYVGLGRLDFTES
jgi:hypothetical protein